MSRICRVCHRPSGRKVCSGCRKMTNLFVRQEIKQAGGQSPPWVAAVRKQLFKS